MPSTVNVTEADLFTALRSFLLAVLGETFQVFKAQGNQVSMPKGSFVMMTPLFIDGLSTNVVDYDRATGTRHDTRTTQFRVQLDVYGAEASANSNIIATLFRSEYATDLMASGPLQPFYATDPKQNVMTNSEQQYEDRWTFELYMQFNPTITSPQQFAEALQINLAEVDTKFPPGAP
ncbi:LIC_12616 family protein [Pseudomonas sp. HS-18]|uniref:phage neck terminator protein n=1 Tax=Pseudomonas sp. HS-18 TaxID=2879114 RepID=UPI001CEFE49B|nr:hypothetical protein [Pseudomonas sp. HS-18]UCL84499.1 hypothetical protein LDJ84_16100 [Pseudomonas sp. HS-18]